MTNKQLSLIIRFVTLTLVIGAVFQSEVQPVVAQGPTPFIASPYYGSYGVFRRWSSTHYGIDFRLTWNPVVAAAEGQVDRATWYNPLCHDESQNSNCAIQMNSGFGLYIRIKHDNPANYYTYYGHLSSARAVLGTVKKGRWIGQSGDSGYSTAPHLHFEVRHGGTAQSNAVNPDNENGVSLWTDGEWITNLPTGNPQYAFPTFSFGPEIIVDDTSSNTTSFSKGCNLDPGCPQYWHRVTSGGYSSDYYWTYDNNSTPDYWADWKPTFPAFGHYRVRAWIPCSGFESYTSGASWRAPYDVQHYDATTPVIVDQLTLTRQEVCNRWVALGGFRWAAGQSAGKVRVTDATGESGPGETRRVLVDAISFVPAHLGPFETKNYRFKTDRSSHSWNLQGDGSLRALPNDGTNLASNYENSSPELEYRVIFPVTGTWFLWVCGKGASSSDDSVHAGLNGVGQSSGSQVTCNPEWRNNSWAWCSINDDVSGSPRRYLTVDTPGVHTVNLWMREDGFYVKKLLLTEDATYTPPAGDCS